MRKRIFIKNLIRYLIPLFIPIMIFGSLSIIITTKYVKSQINKNNSNILMQAKENIELVLNEADSINLSLLARRDVIGKIEEILNKPEMNGEDYMTLSDMKKIIEASAFSRPYIKSVYIYFDNMKKRILTSSDGLLNFDDFYDKLWFDSYSEMDISKEFWITARKIKQYEFEKERTDVITLYRKLSYVSMKRVGAISLNFYTDYISQQLKRLDIYQGQVIIISDGNGNTIFTYNTEESDSIGEVINLDELKNNDSPFFEVKTDTDSFIINQLHSSKYDLEFISITPGKHLYNMPTQLTYITVILLILSLAIGSILTYIFTKKDYRFINNLIGVFERAERGEALPPLPAKTKDEYSFIIYNIIKVFLEQSFLKVQLSERKYKLQTMELIALHSQINPHFLFNTLKTVYWKAIDLTGEHNAVSEMVDCLSGILDYSLNNHEEFVTLEREIRNTKKYIDIQKIRYRDKFDVTWEYESDIENYKMIKLILQPLVENSIYHGIREKEGKCRIKIKAAQKVNKLRISVIDNGSGITREKLTVIRERLLNGESRKDSASGSNKSIGLYNTNRRLKLTYGEEYGLKISSKYGMGTAIYIDIPLGDGINNMTA